MDERWMLKMAAAAAPGGGLYIIFKRLTQGPQ